ncbi:MAG: hydroxymethylbilane synthase [Acidobacteriota bacterium]
MTLHLTLGTRGSKLALAQSGMVADRLRKLGAEVELQRISTRGDQQRDLAFQQIGAPGVFVRELEAALERGDVDLVVHSFKDLPSVSPAGLEVAAIPGRRDAADLLMIRPEAHVEIGTGEGSSSSLPLADGATVGTASARRAALLGDLRPDLEVAHLRGNVPTRLDKLRSGDYDAIVLAAAGLDRLGDTLEDFTTDDLVSHRLDPAVFTPAPSQGALAIQVRVPVSEADRRIFDHVKRIDDDDARRVVQAERRLQALIEGGCQTAFGAWCRPGGGGQLIMDAALGGRGPLRRTSGAGPEPLELAERLSAELLAGASA